MNVNEAYNEFKKIAEEEKELIHRYSDKYQDLKNAAGINAEYDLVWAMTIDEPYYAGYINDIEKMPERQIFKKEPKNKAYASKHYYKDGKPVYSVFLDDKEDTAYEKFYIEQDNMRIGVSYRFKRIFQVSVEVHDGEGKPVRYSLASIKKEIGQPEKIVCECSVYHYEGGHIVSAWRADFWNLSEEMTMYNDPGYDDLENQSIEYMMSVAPMNPNVVNEYKFIYGENGFPYEFSRTKYSHCTVVTNQWKISKAIFEKFNKYGITWFNK